MNHTSDVELPSDYLDLLQRPLFAHLATAGPAGRPQVTPMWFEWDGSRLRFTHTSQRQKYRNVRRDPRVAVSILDPEHAVPVSGASRHRGGNRARPRGAVL